MLPYTFAYLEDSCEYPPRLQALTYKPLATGVSRVNVNLNCIKVWKVGLSWNMHLSLQNLLVGTGYKYEYALSVSSL